MDPIQTEKNCIQVIDGDGIFDVAGIEQFIKKERLKECGQSYVIVAIIGPQSSGKSTLLNHLFGTKFEEMDAAGGRSQTTKGIWLARCVGIETCTLVLDFEGSDGIERGEDDTAFEKQSALFALAVSDIVLINMWCHDIGRVHAANRPLLKTVFQVMQQLFGPRKTTLMFVLRDKTKTPLENLESSLRKDIQNIWDSVSKTEGNKETPFSEFFNVEVVALPSYERQEEEFKEQVASLKQRFVYSISPDGLVGDRRHVVPASELSFSAQKIWEDIKKNKDLDLPALTLMVATVRCEEIADEKYHNFSKDKEWCQMEKAVQSGLVSSFGKKLSSTIKTSLSEYDAEAMYFDEGIRSTKRKQLEENLLKLVQPAYQSMLEHIRLATLEGFKASFTEALNTNEEGSVAFHSMGLFNDQCADAAIEQANWDTSMVRDILLRDINAHIASVHYAKILELNSKYEEALKHNKEEAHLQFAEMHKSYEAQLAKMSSILETLSESAQMHSDQKDQIAKLVAQLAETQAQFAEMQAELASRSKRSWFNPLVILTPVAVAASAIAELFSNNGNNG